MNEIIRELAEQAGFTTNEANMTVGNYKDGNEYFYAEDFIEDELKKFAELIVRECISVARQQRNPANLNYKPSERFVEDLRQHFGVEE